MNIGFSAVEKGLMAAMVGSLMIAVGCSLSWQDFYSLIKRPLDVALGLFCQFILMPFIAILIIKFTNFPPELSIGLLLVSCVPGGSLSNMFTFLSKGDVSLSVGLTVLTTLLASFLMPLLLQASTQGLDNLNIIIPFKNIFITLIVAITPVILGMYIRVKNKDFAKNLEKVALKIGNIIILVMIIIWLPKMGTNLSSSNLSLYITLMLYGIMAMSSAYILGKLFKRKDSVCKTLALETGIQNAPLAFAIITLSFGESALAQYGWVPLVYGAFSVGNAILMILLINIPKINFRKQFFKPVKGR
jgi:bile acid transporter